LLRRIRFAALDCLPMNEVRGAMGEKRSGQFRHVVAVHLFLLRDDEVLLLRRANTGYADGQYSVVAGHLDGDETVQAAARREAQEEAGIAIAPDDIEIVGVLQRRADTPGDDERIDFFVVARRWAGVVRNAEPLKCDDLSWFPLDRLPGNIVPYVRHALDNYRRGTIFDTLGW
jgi:8-oxo-dGTP pyrophosphatase MutT (NUDIX family)